MSKSFVPYDVVVAGAGISGLTCAWALRKAGLRVAVLEASEDVGGCISTVRRDACIADGGPQSFAPTPAFLDIAADLGLDGSIEQAKTRTPYFFARGRLSKAPASPPALLASPLLSPLAKLRLFAEPFVGARISDADESLSSFAARRGGRAIVDAMLRPMVNGIFAGDPDAISARSAFPALVEYERRHGSVILGALAARRGKSGPRPRPVAFAGGNDALPLALAATLASDIRFGADVRGVILRGANVELLFRDESVVARHAVLAVPAYVSAQLLQDLEPDAAEALNAIPYAPVAQVTLSYARSDVSAEIDGFGFLSGADSGLRVLGCTWNSEMFPDRCPPDRVLLTAFLGGVRDADVVGLRDVELVAIVHRDLERALGVSSTPEVIAGFRRERAIPQYNIGHAGRLERVERGMSRLPQMSIVGNYFNGPSVPDCITVARAEAERIVKRLAARDAAEEEDRAPTA